MRPSRGPPLGAAFALFLLVPGLAHGAGLVGVQAQAAPAATMQVSLKVAQVPISTPLGSLALVATVTSGGQAVANATVSFNDHHNHAFQNNGSTATTNSSGVAVACITLVSPFPGNDTVAATATAPGYSPATGTTVVYVDPFGIRQLAVTAAVTQANASGGSTDVVQGYVGTVGSVLGNMVANVGSPWNPAISGISGTTVTISDTAGSVFSSRTVTTNEIGFYSVNFTVGKVAAGVTDVMTMSASRAGYNGSVSSISFAVGPYDSRSLTVALGSFYPSSYSTVLDSAVVEARVSAGGSPVAGATVRFSDSLSSLFEGGTATTDSSGTAITTVYFESQTTGLDVFSAEASLNGSRPGVGSNTFTVRPYGNEQLSVTLGVGSTSPVDGSSERVTGTVGWIGSGTMYAWSPTQTPVPGANVTISDSLGMFTPITVTADRSGAYSASFTVTKGVGVTDVIEASVSDSGYRGSSSSVFLVVSAAQSTATDSANSTRTSSAVSQTSSTASVLLNASTSSGAVGQAKGGGSPLPWRYVATALAAVALVAVCAIVVSRLHRRA